METKPLSSEPTNNCPDNIEEQNLKVLFTPSKRKKTRRINVLIQGEFTINTVLLLKERMYLLFANFDHVDFVVNSITNIDLAAIQLLCVVKSIYSQLEKTITLDFDLSKEDRLIMYHSGLNDLLIKPKLTE
jgi:hypothetical protein